MYFGALTRIYVFWCRDQNGGDDTDLSGLVEEKEFWILVDLCEAAESNTLQPLPDNYTDVFDDLEEFCSDFLDDVDGVMKVWKYYVVLFFYLHYSNKRG